MPGVCNGWYFYERLVRSPPRQYLGDAQPGGEMQVVVVIMVVMLTIAHHSIA